MLEGSSTVTGVQDPNGESQSIRVSGNLTIQGGGSLTARGADTSGGGSYGIDVYGSFTQQGGSVTAIAGNVSGSNPSSGLNVSGTVTVKGGTLTATGGSAAINSSYGISAYSSSVTVSDATVTATSGSAGYASYGLYIESSSPSVTLSGSSSLTARSGSATDTAGGICFKSYNSTGYVTVGDNSTLLANSVILRASSDEKPLAPTGDGSWLIYGQSNQPSAVGGTYPLKENLTIPEDVTLTIPSGSTLTVPQGKTLTVNGTLNIANQSSLTGSGSLAGSGAFNLTNPDPVISGSDTLTYDGTDQFDEFTLTAPTGTVEVMGQSFTISSSPSLDGWNLVEQEIINAGDYTLTASKGTSTIVKEVTVEPAEISIASATVQDKTYDGNTTATVESVTFDNLVNGESLSLGTDYTATAVFDDANAGTDKSATVTVTLSNGNYSLATSTYTLENQTIVQAVFGGTTEISGSVLANSSDEVKLPDIPDGASYGTPTSDAVTNMSITDGVLHYTGGSDITGGTYTITVPVTGATNYDDYNITVTLTGKEIVTVEAEGSKNPSFFTTQDRFTLTATVSGEKLSENPDCWTWDIADKTVADFIDSPTTRSMSVSDSRTFEIKGPGTTTITATYDDGKYHGSVIFSVSISKPTTPDPQPAIYNIYVEDVCDGVEVSTSKQAVKEGGSIIVYVEKDTAHYTFDNFHVYYKEGYYGPWVELPEGVQPGEYPINNIWTHIYIKAEGAEEKEDDPTGMEQVEGVKVYTKDGSLYVQTPQREQVIIVSMTGAVVKSEEQVGLKQYHGLQPGIYIVRVGDRAYKLRLN